LPQKPRKNVLFRALGDTGASNIRFTQKDITPLGKSQCNVPTFSNKILKYLHNIRKIQRRILQCEIYAILWVLKRSAHAEKYGEIFANMKIRKSDLTGFVREQKT